MCVLCVTFASLSGSGAILINHQSLSANEHMRINSGDEKKRKKGIPETGVNASQHQPTEETKIKQFHV